MKVIASLTLSGTAWRSLVLAAGRITVVKPALCAPNTWKTTLVARFWNCPKERFERSEEKLVSHSLLDLHSSPCPGLLQQEAQGRATKSHRSSPAMNENCQKMSKGAALEQNTPIFPQKSNFDWPDQCERGGQWEGWPKWWQLSLLRSDHPWHQIQLAVTKRGIFVKSFCTYSSSQVLSLVAILL